MSSSTTVLLSVLQLRQLLLQLLLLLQLQLLNALFKYYPQTNFFLVLMLIVGVRAFRRVFLVAFEPLPFGEIFLLLGLKAGALLGLLKCMLLLFLSIFFLILMMKICKEKKIKSRQRVEEKE